MMRAPVTKPLLRTAAAEQADGETPEEIDLSRMGLGQRMLGWIYTICGAVGTLASVTLLIEKIVLIRDPAYVPSCSINPILSCGSVMSTPQAEVFGFPNPVIGVIAFPVLATAGVALLAGLRLPRWWWLGLQAGTLFGAGFVTWLFVQSVYHIGALCPYCMVVWVVAIIAFCYTTLHNLHEKHLPRPTSWQSVTRTAVTVHAVFPTLWLLILAVLIGQAFWFYWQTLL